MDLLGLRKLQDEAKSVLLILMIISWLAGGCSGAVVDVTILFVVAVTDVKFSGRASF